ncbi:hypothetical protein B0H13DRAFT_2658089, partial [Mycena leptocephala]
RKPFPCHCLSSHHPPSGASGDGSPRRRLLAASPPPLEVGGVKWRRHLPQRAANRITNKRQLLSHFFLPTPYLGLDHWFWALQSPFY